jgi:biotin carboxyl carrier protein
VPVVLGSRATDLIGGFGGWHGRALRQGDVLPIGEPSMDRELILSRRLADGPPAVASDQPVRVVLGPQADRFTRSGLAAFTSGTFLVTGKSNRQGIRLSGPQIEHERGPDLISEGIAHGAIQVPGDGQPIVLLASRQTVGGYVKIATVIGADLDRLAQLRPGDEVRFQVTDIDAARTAYQAYAAALGPEAIAAGNGRQRPQLMDGLKMLKGGGAIESAGGRWDPDGVVRVLEAVERTGVRLFRLEVESAGVSLEVDRRAGGAEPAPEASSPPEEPAGTLVKAPVIGVFFRRSSPDQPPLAEPGEPVEAGQTLCVLEVMKTYHEVTAPVSGRLEEFLVEDGHVVEYGQPLCRIAPAAS